MSTRLDEFIGSLEVKLKADKNKSHVHRLTVDVRLYLLASSLSAWMMATCWITEPIY